MANLCQFHSHGHVDKHTPGTFCLRDFDHHREIVNQTTWDGASEVQRIGRLLAADPSCLPNTRNVGRDRAHAIRTNLRTPLGSDERMARIRYQLLDKDNSLAKLLQYHPRARKVHQVCQQVVINRDGAPLAALRLAHVKTAVRLLLLLLKAGRVVTHLILGRALLQLGEHALALPSVVLFALFVRVEHAKPSSADVLRAVGYYLACYLVVTHANKTATGLWQYPILADLTAQGGAALRTVFFAVLIGINVAFGFLAKRILCAHEKRA